MRCTACHRELKSEPHMVGRYPYGPVCFMRMFPRTKNMRIERAHVVADDKTQDMFEPCYFDSQGEADRLALEKQIN